MKKQYSNRPVYDDYLQQLDRDIIMTRKQKKQTRSNLLLNIDDMKQPAKYFVRLKYVSSFGVFVVLLFIGYQLFATDILSLNEGSSTKPQDNQTENFFILDEADEADESEQQETIRESKYGERTESVEPLIDIINLILPTYVPGQEPAEPKHVVEVSESAYAYADYHLPEDQSLSVYLGEGSVEDMWQFKFDYKGESFEEFELAGHPSILRLEAEDVAHFSNLHIFGENQIITISTRGIEKEEILKIANSMDLTKLGTTIEVGETSVEDASEELSREIKEITKNLEEVSGTEFKTPSEYEHYFVGEIQADLEKLPKEVQEYILSGASVHIVDTFVHDEAARKTLIEANERLPEFNSNDVDALISNMVDKSYEERLKELIEFRNE